MIGALITKIVSLAMIMAMGWLAVKCGALKSEDSKGISRLSLFLVMPCVILSCTAGMRSMPARSTC